MGADSTRPGTVAASSVQATGGPSDATREGSIVSLGAQATSTAGWAAADTEAAGAAPPGAARGSPLPDRYEDLCLLGRGGFGEVRRVHDRKLGRVVAMKLLRPDIHRAPRQRARFLAEIMFTARLNHPGVIAIYDCGELADGHLWFTMPEVRGKTLDAAVEEAFAPAGGRGAPVARRRLLDVFARVCDAVAYAHRHGVIHRDLKPANVMIGDFGRVTVMDWGIARRVRRTGPDSTDPPGLDDADPIPDPASDEPSADGLTRHGDVVGTPAYMPPEQARGELHRHGPAADVYALGAMLYHLLAGRPPYQGASYDVLKQVVSGPPRALLEDEAPAELAAICARAMAREPEDRYADAAELAVEVEAFLSGTRRRELALEKLADALARGPAIAELRARAARLRADAAVLLSPVRPFDPVEAKRPGWALEDEAAELDREAALGEAGWIQGVHGALAVDPTLPEAHAALADHYREKLAEAERGRRQEDAARAEVLLRAHDRSRHAAFLSGKGALTLVTDPPGARVTLERYALRERRLVPEPAGDLGPTPIVDLPLDKGSYRLRVAAPGRAEVLYPVLVERGERWDGCPPGSAAPYAIPLPPAGEIGADEVYVPAGWAWTGGDPDAPDSLPAARVWIDGFVIGRFPVTNEEYLAFLNDLLAAGREAEALAACPRASLGMLAAADETLAYERGPDGRFLLVRQSGGEIWTPRGPAVLMSWRGATAYARWLAARTGRPYRLPNELEREKAARGVDRRLYPWGNWFDATWARALNSQAHEPSRVDVDAYPLDESPFGLRGGAGNSRDWCDNLWTLGGPAREGGRLRLEPAPDDGDAYRSARGGAWSSVENHCRAAARFVGRPDKRAPTAGVRVARSYP
jgi:serine/threonine-protein kinase